MRLTPSARCCLICTNAAPNCCYQMSRPSFLPPIVRLSLKFLLPLSTLLVAIPANAGSAFFNFNTNPVSGLLSLYGSATWQSSGGAGAATNTTDGYLQITPSATGQRGAVVFADFDGGAAIKGFTFEAD